MALLSSLMRRGRHELDETRVRAAHALERAESLEVEGRLLEAIDAFTDANRLHPDPEVERRLVLLRKAAFAHAPRAEAAPSVVPAETAAQPVVDEEPRPIAPDALTPARLRDGILRSGSVWVRGLVSPRRAAHLRGVIDRAFDAYDGVVRGDPPRDGDMIYAPIESFHTAAPHLRDWQREAGGVLTADFPHALYEFLETLRDLRLEQLIAAYLGERPALSAEKCILRRLDAKPWKIRLSDWHQDGSFLGDGIRTLNLWFCLSPCGRNAPGMEIIPRRLRRVLRTGDEATHFGWTISLEVIEKELPGVPIWRPEFEAGDILLFDELCLHRTSAELGMPDVRYAIESWFFAASVYPRDLSTPLMV
jgi:hypothetical protein